MNINGVYNAYEAAIENDLDRVVYDSSNHAVNIDDIADPSEPETTPDAPTVSPDTPPRPDSCYGISKVAGETTGNYYVGSHGIVRVTVRIGWLMTRDELEATQENPDSQYPADAARFARAMWFSPPDCRHVMQRAAMAERSETPVTVHAGSQNGDRSPL